MVSALTDLQRGINTKKKDNNDVNDFDLLNESIGVENNIKKPTQYIQNNNGELTLNCNELPDKCFIDAVKVRDICKMRILTREEKKLLERGSPDVMVINVIGEKAMITRLQLINNFMFNNGKKIKMFILHENTKYNIQRICNEQYKVFKVPKKYNAVLNNKRIKTGSYVLCRLNPDGQMDRSTLSVISSVMFKKSFKIPMQPVIEHYKNRRNNQMVKQQPEVIKSIVKPIKTTKPIPVQTLKSTDIRTNNQHETSTKEKRYSFTYRILSSTSKKLIGFVVIDKRSHKSYNITTNEAVELCKNKVVDNAMLVSDNTGSKFLRGNGISLTSLPYIMQ